MAEFKVARGTQAVYNGLQSKDNDTLYVATDTGNIYLGSTTLFESNAIVAASASGKTITFTKHGSVGTTTTVTLSLSDMPTTAEMTSAISSAVASLYKFKGSCTYEELPSSGNVVGDVWDVTNEHEQDGYVYPPGTNYAWDGTSWDPLSGKYSQVQADWSENDITQDSFVKNRTHYVTYDGQGTSYPTESSLTLTLVTNHAYGTCYGHNDYPEGFLDNMNVGTKLSLEIGGILYEGVYKASGSTYYIGNGYIMSQGLPDTGGGWCIGTMSKGFDTLKLYLDPSLVGSYPAGSLSFVQTSPTYHTLNDNFISDNIARVSQITDIDIAQSEPTESTVTYRQTRITLDNVNYDIKVPKTVNSVAANDFSPVSSKGVAIFGATKLDATTFTEFQKDVILRGGKVESEDGVLVEPLRMHNTVNVYCSNASNSIYKVVQYTTVADTYFVVYDVSSYVGQTLYFSQSGSTRLRMCQTGSVTAQDFKTLIDGVTTPASTQHTVVQYSNCPWVHDYGSNPASLSNEPIVIQQGVTALIAYTGNAEAVVELTSVGLGNAFLDTVDQTSVNAVQSNAIYTALNAKADKVTGATEGNLAGLDSNGNLTGSRINTFIDENCLIIDVCRRLDLSTVGNKIEIALPDGYVCDPRAFSLASMFYSSYGSDNSEWTTHATCEIKYVNAQLNVENTVTQNIANGSGTSINFTPFIKSYIKIEVTTACAGAPKPFAVLTCRIFCHKE